MPQSPRHLKPPNCPAKLSAELLVAEWVVYTRESCSLCERFLEQLAGLLGERASEVRLVDIGSDPQLEQRFGRKIPVLAIDGDIVCMYQVDAERVRAHLA